MRHFEFRQGIWSISWLLSFLSLIFTQGHDLSSEDFFKSIDREYYPTHVPDYPVRLDDDTKVPVSRDRINLILENSNQSTYSVEKFYKILQCSRRNYNIESRGLLFLISHLKQSKVGWQRSIIRIGSIGMQFYLSNKESNEIIERMKNGNESNHDYCVKVRGLYYKILFRIINDEIYIDYPYGSKCFKRPNIINSFLPFRLFIAKVKDLPDAMFALADESPVLSYKALFPMFSYTSRLDFNDFVMPWYEMVSSEYKLFLQAKKANINFSDNTQWHELKYPQLPWNKRKNSALLRGSRS